MHQVIRSSVCALDFNDLQTIRPAGISVYNGVIVLWDEDFDTRVLQVIDDMPDYERCALFAIHEHEAGVDCFWRTSTVPVRWTVDDIDIDGDVWSVDNHYTN